MGATKTEHFTDKQNAVAIMIKALGHPARIAIVEHLLKVGKCICTDIINEIPLSQPTISQHLRELKNAKIIKGKITRNTICYCLDDKTMKKLQNYFSDISNKLTKINYCC